MQLTRLGIHHVRNLTAVDLECAAGINIVTGDNAAGKSALLEGIYILSTAKSFRTPRIGEVIQRGQDSLTVNAGLLDRHQSQFTTTIEKSRRATAIKYRGEAVTKRSEQIQNVPTIAIVPGSVGLLDGPPKIRRHWLDWALFHVEPGYFAGWHAYYQALRQRNALIRHAAANRDQWDSWEKAMAQHAAVITEPRRRYLNAIQARLQALYPGDHPPVALTLLQADNNDVELRQKLAQQRESDLRMGYTQSGPHRADVAITCEERRVARTFSRGESKKLVILLMLAQAEELATACGEAPVVILDDLTAELDQNATAFVLRHLEELGVQAFVTTLSASPLMAEWPDTPVFHVEHGQVSKVVN